MAALLLNAYGVLYTRTSSSQLQQSNPGQGITEVTRGLEHGNQTLIYSHLSMWSPLGGSRRPLRLPQGEQVDFARPFVVELGTYDSLRITYAYCYQRFDDDAAGVYRPKRTADGGFDVADFIGVTGAHAGLRCGGTIAYNGEYAL